MEQEIQACYQTKNVADGAGLSSDQFTQMIDDPSYVPSTPDAVLCFWDPDGSLGWTVEEAETAQANAKHATYSYTPGTAGSGH